MQEFIEFVVKHLVKEPDQVRVTRLEEDERRETYELEVAEGDIGRVIGKKGGNARALRTLLQAASSMHGQRSALIIKEDRPALEEGGSDSDEEETPSIKPDDDLPEIPHF
jgi:uncharacterized protein